MSQHLARIGWTSRDCSRIPANTRHWPNVVLMLAHRLRRRPNIKTALGKRLVFAGILIDLVPIHLTTGGGSHPEISFKPPGWVVFYSVLCKVTRRAAPAPGGWWASVNEHSTNVKPAFRELLVQENYYALADCLPHLTHAWNAAWTLRAIIQGRHPLLYDMSLL